MSDYPSAVYGWRLFALRGDALVPPFVDYLAGQVVDADLWQRGPNFARCLYGEHFVPDDDCGCGFRATEKLSELLPLAKKAKLPGDAAPVLETSGVLARVKLWGRIRPGVDSDPWDTASTWRASQARLLEMHLAPQHTDAADALYDHYQVPIRTYSKAAWPGKVEPIPVEQPQTSREGYLAAVRAAGLGLFMMDLPEADERLMSMGDSVARTLRSGGTISDLATVIFNSKAQPTMRQARAMIRAVIRYLAPECEMAPDTPLFETPPSPLTVLSRDMLYYRVGLFQ